MSTMRSAVAEETGNSFAKGPAAAAPEPLKNELRDSRLLMDSPNFQGGLRGRHRTISDGHFN